MYIPVYTGNLLDEIVRLEIVKNGKYVPITDVSVPLPEKLSRLMLYSSSILYNVERYQRSIASADEFRWGADDRQPVIVAVLSRSKSRAIDYPAMPYEDRKLLSYMLTSFYRILSIAADDTCSYGGVTGALSLIGNKLDSWAFAPKEHDCMWYTSNAVDFSKQFMAWTVATGLGGWSYSVDYSAMGALGRQSMRDWRPEDFYSVILHNVIAEIGCSGRERGSFPVRSIGDLEAYVEEAMQCLGAKESHALAEFHLPSLYHADRMVTLCEQCILQSWYLYRIHYTQGFLPFRLTHTVFPWMPESMTAYLEHGVLEIRRKTGVGGSLALAQLIAPREGPYADRDSLSSTHSIVRLAYDFAGNWLPNQNMVLNREILPQLNHFTKYTRELQEPEALTTKDLVADGIPW